MFNASPLTSVILVSFHTGSELFASVDSVLRQSSPVELIVVDNGNPESVVAELKAKGTAEPRLRLITGHGNVGFGKANNMGVAAARGDYVLILNPDCVLRDDSLVKLHLHATALPHPFMIGARILNEDGSDQRGCRRALLTPTTAFVEALHLSRLFPRLRLNLHDEPVPASLAPIPAISGAFMFLPRKDYDLIGGFDEGFFLHVEDLDFCLRFRKAGGEIYFAPDVPVTHIGGTSDVTSDFIERCKAKGFIRYIHRNFADKYPLAFLWGLDLAIWMRYVLRRLVTQFRSTHE
ncbi:MAG: glycosyltransferase family 2 protein [Alphaproteobacteria bacterium]|nr:glycosyltransferase family 2 protein [Alphaproteobacteria bacterium]